MEHSKGIIEKNDEIVISKCIPAIDVAEKADNVTENNKKMSLKYYMSKKTN